MFNLNSLRYIIASSLVLLLSSINSVSHATTFVEEKESRIASAFLKPSSILVAKKSKKKTKKLTKAQKRERARINKVIRRVCAGVTASPTFAGKLQVIQDKENQISNTIRWLKKRLKSKRVKKKPSLKRKTQRQIRFNKGLLTATKQLRSEVHAAEARALEEHITHEINRPSPESMSGNTSSTIIGLARSVGVTPESAIRFLAEAVRGGLIPAVMSGNIPATIVELARATGITPERAVRFLGDIIRGWF